jgi:hypothetical protein
MARKSRIVKVGNLKVLIEKFVKNGDGFKIRLNSGGWKGNVYYPMYGQKLEDMSKDNVVVFADVDNKWRVASIKSIDTSKQTVAFKEIAPDGASWTNTTGTMPFDRIICRLKKIC